VEIEARWGPEGYVRDGDFISFDRHECRPERDGDSFGRFPLWANKQFQTFGELEPAAEAKLWIQEVRRATAREHPGFLRDVAPSDEWVQGWEEGFRTLGASDEDVREVLP
jgi:hypothetical protein